MLFRSYTYAVASYKNSSFGLINSSIAGELSGGLYQSTAIIDIKPIGDINNMNVDLKINWKPVAGATRYIVYRSNNPNWSFSKIADVNGNVNAYQDGTVKNANTYYYKISAEMDAVGITFRSPLSPSSGYAIDGYRIMGTS